MFHWKKDYESISMSDFVEKVAEEVQIIDVRTPTEFQMGHIKGATNYPLDKIQDFRKKSEGPLYVICQSGMRSAQACHILSKNGYQVINVKGGMGRWPGQRVQGRN